MREFRQTQVRFFDADPRDGPRDSRSRRFYLWPGEEFGRICRGLDTFHMPKSNVRGSLLLRRYSSTVRSSTDEAVRYLEYYADFW